MIVPFLPMLAVSAKPFDASDYAFEIKWDGVRALAAVEDGHVQLWGRDRADYSARYPELTGPLRRCPSGTVVDGELVILRDGRADFRALLRRHQLVDARKIQYASQHDPVHYILFDQVYQQGRALFSEPLGRRRRWLLDLLNDGSEPPLLFSAAGTGGGEDFCARVVAAGHEGVVAKHLTSRYRPGHRSAAWRKIKPTQRLPCVIVGFTPAADGTVQSLLVAAVRDGTLRYVGQLTAGFRGHQRQLTEWLTHRLRPHPVVDCPQPATWVEPALYCQVQFLQWTAQGYLSGASFRGLITEPVSGMV